MKQPIILMRAADVMDGADGDASLLRNDELKPFFHPQGFAASLDRFHYGIQKTHDSADLIDEPAPALRQGRWPIRSKE